MISNLLETRCCTQKCKSPKHAYDLIALITKTDDVNVLLSGLQQCWNCHRVYDTFGRYLIHIAASCGRVEVVDWLIKLKKADINVKTFENGWTPAHCAAFYGQIDVLVQLIKNGVNLNTYDYDRLTPIEILAADKLRAFKHEPSCDDDFDVYTWGSNINYSLGHSNEIEKLFPEMNEYFRKSNIAIVQVVMSKFHTIFRDNRGLVYTCGHGKDGRLGHNNEETYMIPTLVSSLKDEKCVHVAASRNNSYFLSNDGNVKSCGTNEFKQLGQLGEEKSLLPKALNNLKGLKGVKINGIECGRFHCALLSSTYDVYTFGLNAGQLGHPKEIHTNSTNCYLQEPRVLKELVKINAKVESISCSNGATVCLDKTNKKAVYLCYEYKCKRLHNAIEGLKKVKCYGGKLDYQANSDVLDPEFGDPLYIVGLTESNTICILKESDMVWRTVNWTSSHKRLQITDFDLNKNGLIICTRDGLCYILDLKKTRLTKRFHSVSNKNDLDTTKYESDSILEFNELYQVPFVYRCYTVVSDINGRNYAALQYSTLTNMTLYPKQDPSTMKHDMAELQNGNYLSKNLSDICLVYKNKRFHVHKFILASRCTKFFNKYELDDKSEISLDEQLSKANAAIFQMLLSYIYTSRCDANLIIDALKSSNCNSQTQLVKFLQIFKELCDRFDLKGVKQAYDSLLNNIKNLPQTAQNEKNRFDAYVEYVVAVNKFKTCTSLKFSRQSYNKFYDCEIECADNKTIGCHKCILIARNDYFNNMLLGNWMESQLGCIQLPFDSDLMTIILDYLYTDDIIYENFEKADKEIEILFNLFILSDQILIERLENLCEFKLANLINLKNAIELLQFSIEYNALQLKEFCFEFLCNNLMSLIEAKSFDGLDFDLLNDIKKFYLNFYEHIGSKRITPYSDGLNVEDIDIVPIELLYNQKFLDGTIMGDEDVQKKKSNYTIANELSENVENKAAAVEVKNFGSMTTSPKENGGDLKDESYGKKQEEHQKWEKVRKKKNKKVANGDGNEQTPKNVVVGAFFTEEDAIKYQKEKNLKEPVPVVQIENKIVKEPHKPSNSIHVSIKTNNIVIKPNAKVEKAPGAWGVVTTPKSSSSFSLLDVMNEELQKMSISKPPANPILKPKSPPEQQVIYNSPPKGWNTTNPAQISPPTNYKTMAQIIELEQKYKEQYRKLTNRNMDLIQLEEKAIEDLKILYDTQNCRDIHITIELEQDTDINVLSACVPLWKKF